MGHYNRLTSYLVRSASVRTAKGYQIPCCACFCEALQLGQTLKEMHVDIIIVITLTIVVMVISV